MKKYLPFLLILIYSTITFGQSNWDVAWTMEKIPFLDEKTESEMSIVKGGYDTDQDGWG